MAKKPRKADPFSVYGTPPQALLKGLSKRQETVLRRYIEAVGGSVYRLAFDNGVSHAFGLVSDTVDKEWKRQRDRVARS